MKTLLAFLLIAIVTMTAGCGQIPGKDSKDNAAASQITENEGGTVQISFPFTKQDITASNQFAVWIENAKGDFIKTLFVTDFTASGGYEQRSEALPAWVERSGIKSKISSNIDAFSGATPTTGAQEFSWDCKGKNGKVVSDGTYHFYVEATLHWNSRVLYTGEITIGGAKNSVKASAEYFGADIPEKDMIGEVSAIYLPNY